MSKQRITTAKKRTRKQERREEERRLEQQRLASRTRTTRMLIFVAAIAILAGFGIVYLVFGSHNSTSSYTSGTNTSSSNTSSTSADFAPVNGVSCDSGEHYEYHHHIHLSVYINGQPVAIPQNIGINTDTSSPCLYWLHTHDTSGIVHIESPVQRTYTLGNFFDVWSQRFTQLGYPPQLSQAGGWQIYVNGQVYTGNFRSIPMDDHTLITMAYNSPGVQPETTYNWNGL